MMLDFPTDWLPRKTILILIFPLMVLTELFMFGTLKSDSEIIIFQTRLINMCLSSGSYLKLYINQL